jgi:hypothetical protein
MTLVRSIMGDLLPADPEIVRKMQIKGKEIASEIGGD